MVKIFGLPLGPTNSSPSATTSSGSSTSAPAVRQLFALLFVCVANAFVVRASGGQSNATTAAAAVVTASSQVGQTSSTSPVTIAPVPVVSTIGAKILGTLNFLNVSGKAGTALGLTQNLPSVCQEKQFRCGDGLCIPLSFVCDNEPDCEDHSDELGGCRNTDQIRDHEVDSEESFYDSFENNAQDPQNIILLQDSSSSSNEESSPANPTLVPEEPESEPENIVVSDDLNVELNSEINERNKKLRPRRDGKVVKL